MIKTAKSGNRRSTKKPLGKEESKKVLGQRGHLHLFCAYAKGDTLVRLNSGQARRQSVFRSPPLAFSPHSGVVNF